MEELTCHTTVLLCKKLKTRMKEMQINESKIKIKEKRADLEKDYEFMSCFVPAAYRLKPDNGSRPQFAGMGHYERPKGMGLP